MQNDAVKPPEASADRRLLKDKFDVVVVGNDPSGYFCSRAAAQEGVHVLHLDSKAPTALCPEWVITQFSQGMLGPLKSPSLPRLIIQDTHSVTFHRSDARDAKPIRLAGKIYDRQVFDHALRQQAKAAGAHFINGAFVRNVKHQEIEIDFLGESIKIRARMIVGADGVRSQVRPALGLEAPEYLASLQYRVRLTQPNQSVHFYGSSDLRQGLGWFIPRGMQANVGFGVLKPVAHVLMFKLHQILDRLIAKGWIEADELSYKSGGLIPIGNPTIPPGEDGMFLLGDAMGLRDPVVPEFGIGLGTACTAGTLAGEFIAEELRASRVPRAFGYARLLAPLLDGRLKLQTATQPRPASLLGVLQKF